MPFIPINLNEAEEPKPVVHGKYDLVVSACEETLTREQQKPQFKVTILIQGHDDAPPVWHYVGIPGTDEEPDKAKFKALLLRRFLNLFKVSYDPSGFDTEKIAMEIVGATANAELQISEYNGNTSNVLIVPKLANEETLRHIFRSLDRLLHQVSGQNYESRFLTSRVNLVGKLPLPLPRCGLMKLGNPPQRQ